MAFTPFSTDVKNIEGLGTNRPNADLSMTGLALRQKFDKAVSDIKLWINNTFLSEIGGSGGAENIGLTTPTGMEATNVQDAIEELADNIGSVNDGAVTTVKLADTAVTTAKIAANAVTKEKLEAGATYTTATATLTASTGWTNKQQTVNVEGVTAENTVIVSSAPANYVAYCEAQIRAVSQATGTITFSCEEVPSVNIGVNIIIPT